MTQFLTLNESYLFIIIFLFIIHNMYQYFCTALLGLLENSVNTQKKNDSLLSLKY